MPASQHQMTSASAIASQQMKYRSIERVVAVTQELKQSVIRHSANAFANSINNCLIVHDSQARPAGKDGRPGVGVEFRPNCGSSLAVDDTMLN
jgi:hypothetical protein